MDDVVNNEQWNNNDVIEALKKIATGTFCVMFNYISSRTVFDYRRLRYVFIYVLAILIFLAWLHEMVYDTNLYEHLTNVCWNMINYSGNLMLNLSLSNNLNSESTSCFAEVKLVESSERGMLLLLLVCCTLRLSILKTLWRYIILAYEIFGKDEFYVTLWEYTRLHFSKFAEDEFSRYAQTTTPTVVDKYNPLCISKSHFDLPCDAKYCLLSSSSTRLSSSENGLPNFDVTEGAVIPFGTYFHSNGCKIGYIVFSGDLTRFSGTFQYPLPKKKAKANRVGYCRNGIVFMIYHGNKQFVVKMVLYRPKEIMVYSQLFHPNIINLEAVMIGKKHKHHEDKYYAYYFMMNMGVNLKNVFLAKAPDCLKCLKTQLDGSQWQLVLLNVKHILRCVLDASGYMNSQGIVHNNIKPSNVLIKMMCQCSDMNVLFCSCCKQTFAVKLTGLSSTEDGYDSLNTSVKDRQAFGHLVLNIFVGNYGQKFKGPQNIYCINDLVGELRMYFADTPELCDLVQKCFQVDPNCQPTSEELLQLKFFNK